MKQDKSVKDAIDEITVFCKRKGFVFPSSELYGGFSGFFDYGPFGVELKNNIKQEWWNLFVKSRDDIVGIDGAIISHPKIWKASGHVDCFEDLFVEDEKTKERYRADLLVEEAINKNVEGLSPKELLELIQKNKIKSPKGNALSEPKQFNLMFKTNVGPLVTDKSETYLRPETAQLIFANFKNIVDTCRVKLPFGIAQIGKAFRNEISPRNFLFRTREFEQMEIEYFVNPQNKNKCPFIEEVADIKVNIQSSDMQNKNQKEKEFTLSAAIKDKIIKNQWHAYWLGKCFKFFTDLGANPINFRLRQHLEKEKSHYATDTWDLEYKFPFGFKELLGIADRGTFDLSQHIKHSGKDLSIFDQETNKKVLPEVIAEPSFGVDRAFLVFVFDAYENDKKRGNIVLKISPRIAPVKVAVFPLVNKLDKEAYTLHKNLNNLFTSQYDRSGSVGRRYARADEIGIPYTITFDFDSLKDKSVTIRDRDTTKQIRVPIKELEIILSQLINRVKTFDKFKNYIVK